MSKTAIKFIFLLVLAVSCKSYSLKKEYEEKHDKYRTLWYRTGSECMFDSCRKYGLLYDSILGLNEPNINILDTVTVTEVVTCE